MIENFDRIKEILESKVKGKVRIAGWVENLRSSGGVQFFIIRDGSGVIQVTIHKNDVDKKIFEDADKLTQESSVIIEGEVKKDKRAPESRIIID